MPSTRWLLLAVIAVYSTLRIKSAIAAEIPDSLPLASNGWRPIIGTHEVKSYITVDQSKQSANGHNKQTILLTADKQNDKNKQISQNQKGSNGGNQVHVNHHGSTGHRNKLQPAPIKQSYKPTGHGNMHVVTGKPTLRHPVMSKLHAHMTHSASNKRHKPSNNPQGRPQHPLSLRDEIMAPAPSSAIGSYAFFNQGPLHIQNTPLGNKPYHTQSHIDFSNHFAFSNGNPEPVQPYYSTFQKHPSQNELHSNHYAYFNQNTDFTRNLVPPPPFYKPQGEKEVIKDIPKHVEQQSATINNPQLVHGKVREEIKHVPGNLVLQLQPSYNHYQHQTAGNPSLDFEITKENFKEYHTTLAPVNYKPSTESYLGVSTFTKPKTHFTKPSFIPGYQVTEEKEWAAHLPGFKHLYSTVVPLVTVSKPYKTQFSTHVPDVQKYQFQQQVVIPQDPNIGQFLPTPYNPESTFATSPTQTDVSTVYSAVGQSNRKKHKTPFQQLQTTDPTKYNIKEVATHFPIYAETNPDTQISMPVDQKQTLDYENEVTTKKPESQEPETTIEYVKPTQQTTFPTRGAGWNKRRPGQRRRRPTRPTTTTEAYEPPSEDIYENYRAQEEETERPTEKPYHHRRRRPMKYRTTEPPQTELVTISEPTTRASYSIRSKPQRGQPQTITEESFVTTQGHRRKQHKQHKYEPEESYPQQQEYEQDFTTRQHPRFGRPKENYRQQVTTEETTTQYQYEPHVETEAPTTEYIRSYTDYKYPDEFIPETTERAIKIKQKRRRLRPTTTTTEILPTTNIIIPENELDYTTIPTEDEQFEETVTAREYHDFEAEREPTTILETSTAEVTATTTTTEAPTTSTKANRIRQRPMKYDVQRPRFSVKDYRQRLSHYMSTSTSTESSKSSSESPSRIRYPTRFRLPSTNIEEESTEMVRQKFIPKDARHRLPNTESNVDVSSSTTEKYLRGMSSRIRPFGRLRSTTELPSTTTQKVSIKTNIFNNLKRPQQLSLRNRIFNKKRNHTQSTTESIPIEPESNELITNTEKTEVTLQLESAESKIEVTTQLYDIGRDVVKPTTQKTTAPTRVNTFKTNDVDLRDDEIVTPDEAEAFLQLQRISDLTSSAHNTPGMFKSVSPTSRRVPSYFTIATEDPILPIEAFFPNLNHKQ